MQVMEGMGVPVTDELGQDVLNDLLVLLMRQLSPQELFRVLLSGELSPLDQMRASVQLYLREHTLRQGGSEEAVRSEAAAVDAILADWRPVLGGAVAGLTLQVPRLRVVPSLETALREVLRAGLRRLLAAQQDAGFGAALHGLVLGVMNLVGSLVGRAFGRRGLRSFCERLLRQWVLSTETRLLGLNSANNAMLTDMVVQLVRDRLETWRPVADVTRYLVFDERPPAPAAVQKPPGADTTDSGSSRWPTPAGWQEAESSRDLLATDPAAMAAAVAAIDGRATDAASWQAVVPPEWIPIIQRDVQQLRENGAPPATPFSDGYVDGQPAKRRKVVMTRRAETSLQSSDAVLADTLREVAAGAAEPVTRTLAEAVAASASENGALNAAFRQYAAQRVARRLSANPDYSAERFPLTQRAFLAATAKSSANGNGLAATNEPVV